MKETNLIKRKKYHIWNSTDGKFPQIPKIKYVRDFNEFVDKLEISTDTIFDLLWLYNISGLLVEKIVSYKDPDSEFGVRVAYTIFGTYVKENDTDQYFPEAETGPYNLGNTSSWDDNMDISMWIEDIRPLDNLQKDITAFYDTSKLNISN